VSDRSRSYSTEAIVIRRRNIGEADSILTVFSLQEGKFDAVARGVRKARSKMRGHLEPLTHVQAQIARGRSLDVFTQAETITSFRALKDNLDALTAGLYCCELVDRFTVDRAAQRAIYELLLDILGSLDSGASIHVARYFEQHLLAATGYEIQLDACAICHARLPEEDTLLSPSAGGLVCKQCRPLGTTGHIVSVRAIKVLRHARSCSVEAFAALRLDDDLAHQLQVALGDIVRTVMDRETNTGRYLDAIRNPVR